MQREMTAYSLENANLNQDLSPNMNEASAFQYPVIAPPQAIGLVVCIADDSENFYMLSVNVAG